MSAIQFITSGGMASIGGDLPEEERKKVNEVVKSFGDKVRKYALSLQVPASLLSVQQCTFLFVGKDTSSYHIVFANAPGGTSINYRDLSSHGRLELQSITHQVRIEVGDVVWAFSYPQHILEKDLEEYVQQIVVQYVNSVLEAQQKPEKRISEQAISTPEIASGLEKFRKDYPNGTKTAFIIMQFGNTKLHNEIVETIKEILKRNNIVGLRADDKEYMDDLFPNVKVYMHACDFGIAVFDRITENDFNPNVTLEVGYMLGMGKDVLLLKDKTLKSLSTDLTGRLYKQFDTTEVKNSLPEQLEKWLSDKGLK
ncbi:hypothetical protein [Acidihalobacter aeolianus]|uniref:hypothetical protein n=1 Tax=Acidihalobacter aeolianus TaxID=2792603 RepID=UPI000B2B6D69|nr:hypothetical protein [Acidihalobacter aeolianus]